MRNDIQDYKGQRAISYARASVGKGRGQEDSTDRQRDSAVIYCKQKNLNLDLDYSIVDEGVSAFKTVGVTDAYGYKEQRERNLQEGALAEFVRIVEANTFGREPIHLIVEKLDRMYRAEPKRALGHFLRLLERGITIHTMMDGRVYSPNSDNSEITSRGISSSFKCHS